MSWDGETPRLGDGVFPAPVSRYAGYHQGVLGHLGVNVADLTVARWYSRHRTGLQHLAFMVNTALPSGHGGQA
jgi:hypothetical protein